MENGGSEAFGVWRLELRGGDDGYGMYDIIGISECYTLDRWTF